MLLRFVRACLFILCVACLVEAQRDPVSVVAITTAATATSGALSPDPRVVARKDFSLKQTYRDLFTILSARNTCSDFYGGPVVATSVLNQFITSVERGDMPDLVSFRMTGRPRLMLDSTSGVWYRLFDRVIVNNEGAFYRRRFNQMQERPYNVGSFSPGTRPARALILMHELAHLIQGPDGAWLIRDDGSDGWRSKQNTAQVESHCESQLKELNQR
jgi:hypothetical protein